MQKKSEQVKYLILVDFFLEPRKENRQIVISM